MKAIGRLITVLVLTGTLLLLAALSLHVVRSGTRVRVIAKDHLTLMDTYQDVTNWSADDAAKHPALAARMTDAGQGDLLPAGVGKVLPTANDVTAIRR